MNAGSRAPRNVNNGKPLALALGGVATAVLVAMLAGVGRDGTTRSVGPLTAAGMVPTPAFDPMQSAALFVGVSEFDDPQMWGVPYAADDAVDLAHAFAFSPRVRLVMPERVVVAFSGKPRKRESRLRLEDLKRAGVQILDADQSTILTALEDQAARAGSDGILIVSFATHGFNERGIPHILGRSSTLRYPETALAAPRLLEITAKSPARRSLIFIDACRERIDKDRAGAQDARTAGLLLQKMRPVSGQIVFYAAAAGGYSYDDPKTENGVFTKAVLDALRCDAAKEDGVVTALTLHKFVEGRVVAWIRAHRDPSIMTATQINLDGNTRAMPLACCSLKPCWPIPQGPERTSIEGSTIVAWARDGKRLWTHDVQQPIVRAEVADLDADGRNEVVVATQNRIIAFDRTGAERWNAGETGLTLQTFAIGSLFKKDAQLVVALWQGAEETASHVSIIASDGQSVPAFEHESLLKHVAIFQPTNWHHQRIAVATANRIFQLNPSKPNAPEWHYTLPAGETIARMRILDRDASKKRHISISTVRGNTYVLDAKGHVIAPAH